MSDFSCDVEIIGSFKPCGTLQMSTAYKQNLQDLYFNMFT